MTGCVDFGNLLGFEVPKAFFEQERRFVNDLPQCRWLQPDTADSASYLALLHRDPGNLLYATPEFLHFIQTATKSVLRVLVAERDGLMVGALPYAVFDAPGAGTIVNSLPWWGSHGSIVLDRNELGADAVRVALLNRFNIEMEGLSPLSVTMILLPAEQPLLSLYTSLFKPIVTDGRIGQISELPVDGPGLEERLLNSYQQKTRNLVRKGLRQGFLELVTDDDWAWDFLGDTHETNIGALGGRAKPRSHFAALRSVRKRT